MASVASVRFPLREVFACATSTLEASPTEVEVETIGVEVVRGSTVVVLAAVVESLLVVEGFGVVVRAAVVVGSAGTFVVLAAVVGLAEAELPAVVVLLSLGTGALAAVVEEVPCSVLGAVEESVVVSSAVVVVIRVVVDDVVGA